MPFINLVKGERRGQVYSSVCEHSFPSIIYWKGSYFPNLCLHLFWVVCRWVNLFLGSILLHLLAACLYASVMVLCVMWYCQVCSSCPKWLSLLRVFYVSLWILGYFNWFLLLLIFIKACTLKIQIDRFHCDISDLCTLDLITFSNFSLFSLASTGPLFQA